MITLHDLRAARRARLLAGRRDTGSALLMSVLFTVFAGGVLLVLLAVLLSQVQSIRFAQKNTRTGYAAQAGIQSALSVLRSNTKVVSVGATPVTYGDPTALPGTLSGNVDGAAGSDLTYHVTLQYFRQSPSGRSDAWRAANALPVPLSSDPALQPRYVRIVSEGRDAALGELGDVGDRTIAALYTFTTTNINIAGGLIRSTDGTRCLHAASATVGATMTMTPISGCTDDVLDLWVYDIDYRLKLASTLTAAQVLCITGQQWVGAAATTTSATVTATLQPCAATNAAAYGNQLWSWDAPESWVAQNSQNTARSNRWLGLTGTTLVEKVGSGKLFDPAPSVGAGAASHTTNQIVNYAEFGRCMDVTEENISKAYMIVYPCKQDPTGTGANLLWNHKWTYAEPVGASTQAAAQTIRVVRSGTTYCLMRQAAPTNTDVRFTVCSASSDTFVRSTSTGDPLTSYTFRYAGDTTRCLTAVPEPGQQWSHIRLLPCNGSSAQKWNAPAVTSGSLLGSYVELG